MQYRQREIVDVHAPVDVRPNTWLERTPLLNGIMAAGIILFFVTLASLL